MRSKRCVRVCVRVCACVCVRVCACVRACVCPSSKGNTMGSARGGAVSEHRFLIGWLPIALGTWRGLVMMSRVIDTHAPSRWSWLLKHPSSAFCSGNCRFIVSRTGSPRSFTHDHDCVGKMRLCTNQVFVLKNTSFALARFIQMIIM